MGRKVSFRERTTQKGVCFKNRQIEFLGKYADFKISQFCQAELDKQIALINPDFLEKKEENEEGTNAS